MSNQACSVKTGRYQSGQLGQTVNLLSDDFVGSNPALPTLTVPRAYFPAVIEKRRVPVEYYKRE